MTYSHRRQWELRLLRYVADRLMRERPDLYGKLGDAYEWWTKRSASPMPAPRELRRELSLLDEMQAWITEQVLDDPAAVGTLNESGAGYSTGEGDEPEWRKILDQRLAHDRPHFFPIWHSATPIPAPDALKRLLGKSIAWHNTMHAIERAVASDITTLLIGETGTGKSFVARVIHDASHRRRHPFVRVDCHDLTDANLFEKCSPPPSLRENDEEPCLHRGTLFFDELTNLSTDGQKGLIKLLDRIEEVSQQGGYVPRIILSSVIPLDRRVTIGEFRQDLYFRISIYQVDLPPLRQRRDDIALLAEHMIPELAAELGVVAPKISREALNRLHRHHWMGNIRELNNVLKRTIIQADRRIEVDDVQLEIGKGPDDYIIHLVEKDAIEALEASGISIGSVKPALVRFLRMIGQQRFGTSDIVDDLGVAQSTARSYTSKLVDKGFLIKYGMKKGTTYKVVVDKLFKKTRQL